MLSKLITLIKESFGHQAKLEEISDRSLWQIILNRLARKMTQASHQGNCELREHCGEMITKFLQLDLAVARGFEEYQQALFIHLHTLQSVDWNFFFYHLLRHQASTYALAYKKTIDLTFSSEECRTLRISVERLAPMIAMAFPDLHKTLLQKEELLTIREIKEGCHSFEELYAFKCAWFDIIDNPRVRRALLQELVKSARTARQCILCVRECGDDELYIAKMATKKCHSFQR